MTDVLNWSLIKQVKHQSLLKSSWVEEKDFFNSFVLMKFN